MDGSRYGLALTAGMLATVNPCGLPMLPAYLSYFISGDDATSERSTLATVLRALGVAGVVSLGFIAVFGTLGAVVSWVTRAVYDVAPWITVVVGGALVVVGVLLLAGKDLTASLPKLDKGGRTRGLWSMFLFGMSYAVASVSCTLPIFLSQVSATLGQNALQGLAVFAFYALGMALVLMALSVSLALARNELVQTLRNSLRIISRVAGGFLVLAGLYIAWYGTYEIRDTTSGDPAVDRVTGWSADVQNVVNDIGAFRVAGVLGAVILVAIGTAVARSSVGGSTRRAHLVGGSLVAAGAVLACATGTAWLVLVAVVVAALVLAVRWLTRRGRVPRPPLPGGEAAPAPTRHSAS